MVETILSVAVLSITVPGVTILSRAGVFGGVASTTPTRSRVVIPVDEDIAMLDTPRHGLSQVAIRSQLSCHVALGFSRHVVIVSVITFSYDIETDRSWMRWKGDDGAIACCFLCEP